MLTNAALRPGMVLRTLATNISPTENWELSTSLLSSINFPSLSKAKSTAEEFDRIINSLFTLLGIVPNNFGRLNNIFRCAERFLRSYVKERMGLVQL